MTTMREMVELSGRPEIIAHFQRIEPRSYEELVSRLTEDVDILVGLIESDAKDFGSATEDEITRELVRLLKARCYHATHDSDEGGHVDVRVASPDGRFSWLGEAKIYRSNSYLDAGMEQLINRYVKGTPGNNAGALLVYVQVERCAERLAEWKAFHENQSEKYEDLVVTPCATRPGLAFYSEFVLPRIGKGAPKYRVRHLAVSLYRAGTAPQKPNTGKKKAAAISGPTT